jgi:uncharacterized protein
MSDLVIHLPDIDEGGREYKFALTPEWMARVLGDTPLGPAPEAGPGSLVVWAQRNGSEILVDGRLVAPLVTECARCLGRAPVPVDTRLTVLLTPAGSMHDEPPASDDVEDEDKDPDRVPYTGSQIPLDDLVREHLVLECPMQPLCAPDCPGIDIPAHVRPPAEAPGPKVDPRFQALGQWMGKLPSNKARSHGGSET